MCNHEARHVASCATQVQKYVMLHEEFCIILFAIFIMLQDTCPNLQSLLWPKLFLSYENVFGTKTASTSIRYKKVFKKSVVFILQEAIVKIMKMRKRITNAALQTELVEILRNMFLPSKKLIKEQIEWLIEHKYMKRDEENINMFIYMA